MPAELQDLDKSRLFTTYATLFECLRDRDPVVRTLEANIRRTATVIAPTEVIAERALDVFKAIRPLRPDGPSFADSYIAARPRSGDTSS